MQENILITAEAVTLKYGTHIALRNVSLNVRKGEILTIVGPNGSGKSSLMRALIGALPPVEGHIKRKDALKTGYVPQKLMIDDRMPLTVNRFLQMPHRVSKAAASRALARVGAQSFANQQLTSLSGGQLQRALLARALLNTPDVLMLDEPTQGLDQSGSADFYELIETLRDELGCAIVMVSHELHVVMAASDRVICLNGHICCQGAPAQVARAQEYRALFGNGTRGALALYRHEHDHQHEHGADCTHPPKEAPNDGIA